ncbi:hypothetical protein [Amycolatopsis sp. NBC_01480]|uniref:hypothetical protein n=1 Tax=Amycolatopsis sp. NBC_01480 TaxID=2903562 RepID=UPI002E281D48|nr:hypothetical protein [Amycolatopsis sp. NBC_01480]
MPAELELIRAELAADPDNAWARELGYEPVFAAAPGARIALIGQAPGRKAQESGVPWDDASAVANSTGSRRTRAAADRLAGTVSAVAVVGLATNCTVSCVSGSA